jgi:hypothetical protein
VDPSLGRILSASSRGGSLSPDKLGAFLSGFFTPIFFLWIVVGYLQQSNELRLQVQELTHQVSSGQRLVEETAARSMREIAQIQPHFLLGQITSRDGGRELTLINRGGPAYNVRIGEAINISVVPLQENPLLVSDASLIVRISSTNPSGWFQLRYGDRDHADHFIWAYFDGHKRFKSRRFGEPPITGGDDLQDWFAGITDQ